MSTPSPLVPERVSQGKVYMSQIWNNFSTFEIILNLTRPTVANQGLPNVAEDQLEFLPAFKNLPPLDRKLVNQRLSFSFYCIKMYSF